MYEPARRLFLALCLTLAAGLGVTAPAVAQPAGTSESKYAAIVVDAATGEVLYAKNADAQRHPASITKIMTLYLTFEALANGKLRLDEQIPVSSHAAAQAPTKLGIHAGGSVSVDDAMRAIAVKSANDMAVALAEKLGGSESNFASLMTVRAQELGMINTHYANASGWPDPGQLMSMHDLAMLAIHIMKTYPQYYHYFSEQSFAYDGRAPANEENRDPLLGRVPGADGMKTGHTEASGYGLVGTAVQGGRRVLVVFNGTTSMAQRGSEGEKLLNWAFRQFAEKTIIKKGDVVAEAPVWMGTVTHVNLVPADDAKLLVPVTLQSSPDAKVVYTGPLKAPIKAGTTVADLVVSLPDMPDAHIPLVAQTDVPVGGVMRHFTTAAQVLYQKFTGAAAGQ